VTWVLTLTRMRGPDACDQGLMMGDDISAGRIIIVLFFFSIGIRTRPDMPPSGEGEASFQTGSARSRLKLLPSK